MLREKSFAAATCRVAIVGLLTGLSIWSISPKSANAADTLYVDRTTGTAATATDGSLNNPYKYLSTALARIVALGPADRAIAIKGNGVSYDTSLTLSSTYSGSSGHPFSLCGRGIVTFEGANSISGSDTLWRSRFASGSSTTKVWWTKTIEGHQVIANDRRYPYESGGTISTLPSGRCKWIDGTGSDDSLFAYFLPANDDYTLQSAQLCVRVPIKVTGSYIIVDHLTILRGRDEGVLVDGGGGTIQGVTVRNCTIQLCGEQGIEVKKTTLSTFNGNACSANSKHGIYLDSGSANGTSYCTVQDNVCFDNNDESVDRGGMNGIRIGSSSITATDDYHTVERNQVHDNEDSGIEVNDSNHNLLRLNRSWRNGDHGYDHNNSSYTRHLGDLAYANDRDGISIENDSPHTSLTNCVLLDNGQATNRKDWELEVLALSGFTSDYNLIYRPSRAGPTCGGGNKGEDYDNVWVNYGVATNQTQAECPATVPCNPSTKSDSCFTSVSAYSASTGQDTHSIGTNPQLADAGSANFVPTIGSPLIDAGDSSPSDWPSTDARGMPRVDFYTWPSITDTGHGGPRTYDDIGPIELGPPGAPTIDVISWGDTYIDVTWSARGDEYDTATAWKWELFINGVLKTSGTPGAPGDPQSVSPTGLTACTNYSVKIRITSQDTLRKIESDTVSGTTCCTDECDVTRPGARAIAVLQDYPLNLSQPQPSPARDATTVGWSIPRARNGAAFNIALFDVSGRRVATVAQGAAKAGKFAQRLIFNTASRGSLNSGVYFLRLQIGEQRISKTIIVAR